ncbi:MAG: TRAP transporter large permease subunit, partial [Casimicrobium sp.]
MTAAGLWMLLALGVLVTTTGLPVWALLLGTSSAFAIGGLLMGAVDFNVLAALSPRIIGLLENDLLQALPLYVFIGVLLKRVTVADSIFSTLVRIFRPFGTRDSVAAVATLTVGSLIAPMSGSVGSSASLLSRLVGHRLRHLAPARAIALVSAAATIGVVVPPSLVLILLGDAMLRAHLEASNMPGFSLGTARIISTQDVFNAALVPALAALLLWMVMAWWQGRITEPTQSPDRRSADDSGVTRSHMAVAFAAITVIVLLLVGVFSGKLFAVEAAAAGGCLLILATLASHSLPWAAWREVLHGTFTLSGALFALLVGATTFSLVFRAFGTDRWLSEFILQSTMPPLLTA